MHRIDLADKRVATSKALRNRPTNAANMIIVGAPSEALRLGPARLADYAASLLDQDCIRPILRGISSIRVVNGTETSEPLTGHIVLTAGSNMRLTPIIIGGQDPQIRFDAISGEGLIELCVCSDEVETGPPIRVINSVPPLPNGDFTLLGNDCLEITPLEHGLQLVDKCSAPCCGCSELEVITADLSNFGNEARTLENFINRLETSVTQFSNTVLGSRLNDRCCVTCE